MLVLVTSVMGELELFDCLTYCHAVVTAPLRMSDWKRSSLTLIFVVADSSGVTYNERIPEGEWRGQQR